MARGFAHFDDFPLTAREVFTRYVGIGRKQFKRVVEPCAGLQQKRKIASEGRYFRMAWLPENAKAGRHWDSPLLLYCLDR